MRVALAVFLLQVLCLCLFIAAARERDIGGYGGFLTLRDGDTREARLGAIQDGLAERMAPFDGQFYLDIARHGYRSFSVPPQGNYAFFPLYAWVLSASEWLLGSCVWPVILMQLCLVSGALVIVWVLAERMGIPPWMPVALMLSWPMSVFYVVLYSESVFLFLSVLVGLLSVLGYRRSAACAGFCAGLCRPQGVLLVLVLLPLDSGGNRKGWGRGAFWAVTPVLGFLIYMVMLGLAVGSPWAFVEMQGRWGRSASLSGCVHAFMSALALRGLLLDDVTAMLGVVLIPVLFRCLPRSLAAYGAASVLLPLGTGTTLSMCRFAMVAFPLFLGLSRLWRKHPCVVWGAVALCTVAQVWCIRRLAGWEFVG